MGRLFSWGGEGSESFLVMYGGGNKMNYGQGGCIFRISSGIVCVWGGGAGQMCSIGLLFIKSHSFFFHSPPLPPPPPPPHIPAL